MPEIKNVFGKALWGNYQTPGNHSPFAIRKFGGFPYWSEMWVR